MKKITFVLVIILLIVFLTSCGESVAPKIDRLDELKLQYDPIGVGHNMALDELYRSYSERKIAQNNSLSYSDCIEIGETHFNSPNALHHTIAADIVSLIYDKQLFAKASANAEIIDVLSDSIAIIAKYPQIFDSISVILDDVSSNEIKINKLEKMYLYADDEIEDLDDKNAVMNGISTTIHSLVYWDENMTDWQETLSDDMGKPSLGIIGIMGIIDGTGAVIGTLEGIRDTYKGQEGRLEIIAGRAIGEAAKTSAYAVMAIILI